MDLTLRPLSPEAQDTIEELAYSRIAGRPMSRTRSHHPPGSLPAGN